MLKSAFSFHKKIRNVCTCACRGFASEFKLSNNFKFALKRDEGWKYKNCNQQGHDRRPIISRFSRENNIKFSQNIDKGENEDLLEMSNQYQEWQETIAKEPQSSPLDRKLVRAACTKQGFLKNNLKLNYHIQGEVIYGIHPVLAALRNNKRTFHRVFLKDGHPNSKRGEIEEEANSKSIPIEFVNRENLDELTRRAVHQGACADVSRLKIEPWIETDQCIGSSETILIPRPPVWVVMEQVQDPMNFGAILRSSEFFGIEKVMFTENDSCRLSPIVSKASSGSMEIMDMMSLSCTETFLKAKKEQGWQIVAAISTINSCCIKEVTEISQFNVTKPTILVLGNEGQGLKFSITDICDTLITIKPLNKNNLDSLNVSVAAGIILQKLCSR